MAFLFDYVGKDAADSTYEVAIQNINARITSQTNQVMIRFKLSVGMAQ